MEKDVFNKFIEENHDTIEEIKEAAHKVHEAVNQHYDKTHPYSLHLDAVANITLKNAAEACTATSDILPLVFGAYFHDSIEDARLTYNDVKEIALRWLNEEQSHMAAEIVYALTNEKGRNRSERANDRYYAGIRSTPYAPLCKMADRLANVSYSVENRSNDNQRMNNVYAEENARFIKSIVMEHPYDLRLTVPESMLDELKAKLGQ